MTVFNYWLNTLQSEGLGITSFVVALWRTLAWPTPEVLRGDDE